MPTGRSSVQVSWGFPVLEVCVIGKDNEGILGPTQIVPPMGEGFHHGKQLSFVDVVIAFSRSERGGIVCDGVEFGFPFFYLRGCPPRLALGRARLQSRKRKHRFAGKNVVQSRVG